MKNIFLSILSVFLISSCAIVGSPNVSQLDYLNKGEKFDIKNFFNGSLEAFAIVQNSDEQITGTEIIKIEGSWEGNKGVIKEVFTLSDGSKDSRTWLITTQDNGDFTAIGHDIVVPAQGKQMGNAMQMSYSLSLPDKATGQKVTVNFDNKIYLVKKDAAIMISKSGSRFGSSKKLIISLKKISGNEENNSESKDSPKGQPSKL